MQADRVGESPRCWLLWPDSSSFFRGWRRRCARAVRPRTAEPFVSAFFLPVIYKTQLTLVTFQAATGAGRAPSHVCPLCLCAQLRPSKLVGAGMTLPGVAHVWFRSCFPFPTLFLLKHLICCWQLHLLWPPLVIFHDSSMGGLLAWQQIPLVNVCLLLNLTFLRLSVQITSASKWKTLIRFPWTVLVFFFQTSMDLLVIITPHSQYIASGSL